MRKRIKRFLRKHGLDIVSYDPVYHPVARRLKLMSQYKINLVFDVGANTGQYGTHIREIGYRGRIVSFEPLTSAFNELKKCTNNDSLWNAVNMALGDQDGTAEINISRNSQSSSLRDILPSHVEAAPESAYVGKETIEIRKLDSIFNTYWKPSNNLYLKIDAQGYERNIIEGGQNCLDRVTGVQMEVSLVPLYEGETLLVEMIKFMSEKGFVLMSMEPTYGNAETGQLLQTDCVFFRSAAV